MTRWHFIRRSLRYFAPVNVPVLLAATVCTAVITGALLVGDSVRGSLLRLVRLRLGRTVCAVSAGDRLAGADLARRLEGELGVAATAVLRLPGVISVPGTDLQLSRVRILGVDTTFAEFSPEVPLPVPAEDGAAISVSVARKLNLSEGDTIVLRTEKITALPRGTPLAGADQRMATMRLQVQTIVGEQRFGRFSLRAEHLPPDNVFVSREALCRVLGLDDRANTILLAGPDEGDIRGVEAALEKTWLLADAGLRVHGSADGAVEVTSRRVFIDGDVAREAQAIGAGTSFLSYFVTAIRSSDQQTPYSFVSGSNADWLPPDLGEEGMAVTQWLADDLQCRVGDRVALAFLVPGPMNSLEERRAEFVVRAILPMERPYADPSLMPDIPGLADAGSCTEWHPGIPIELERIRKKDEVYWERWKGAPKAYISLSRARELWANEFGNTTLVRLTETQTVDAVNTALLDRLTPLNLGFQVDPVLADGVRAGTQSVDFAQLFLGLSFFLIVAALVLTGLLFALAVERRREQVGTLLAVGFTPWRIRALFMLEGLCLAIPAAVAGGVLGILYNVAVVNALTTVWQGSVGDAQLRPFISPSSVASGCLAGWLGAVTVIGLVIWRLSTATVQQLHTGPTPSLRKVNRRLWPLIAGLTAAGAGAILIVLGEPGRGRDAAGTFFGAGALMLAGGMGMLDGLLDLLVRVRAGGLSLRNAVRRRSRSLAVTGVLACAVFLVVAVGANRHGPASGLQGPSSGTGGFDFYAETSLPVMADLNTADGRRELGLREDELADMRVVHMSLSEGDDASCLNLNRSARPKILGVSPHALAERGAFSFVKQEHNTHSATPWLALLQDLGDEEVPVVADHTVIVWGLGLSVGDALTIQDGRGRPLRLRFVGGIANSVLQGHVILSDEHFQKHFPGEGGSRVMLIEVADDRRDETTDLLENLLADHGLVITAARRRLAAFHRVENTYLAIFLALGGLGLLLGSAGLAAVVVRNVLERRSELALLRAVGFGRVRIGVMITIEHVALLLAGLAVGALAGLVAVLPAVAGPGGDPDLQSVALWCILVFFAGCAWIVMAASVVTRGNLIEALRAE